MKFALQNGIANSLALCQNCNYVMMKYPSNSITNLKTNGPPDLFQTKIVQPYSQMSGVKYTRYEYEISL